MSKLSGRLKNIRDSSRGRSTERIAKENAKKEMEKEAQAPLPTMMNKGKSEAPVLRKGAQKDMKGVTKPRSYSVLSQGPRKTIDMANHKTFVSQATGVMFASQHT